LTLFVDTSALYAAVDAGDRNHEQATAVLASGEPLVTSDHVLVEGWLLIRGRLSRRVADEFWAGLRAAVSVESVGPADLEVAWMIGQEWMDQDFSIVDRTSFAVMQRLGILRAATYDDDFAVFRFGRDRTRAFELVR